MKYTETGFFHFLTIFCFLNIFVILVDLQIYLLLFQSSQCVRIYTQHDIY